VTLAPAAFATDTAVEPLGDGRWAADLSDRWSSLVGIHGGYVAAIAARAIGEAIGDPARPLRTLSAQFLRSPRPGPVEVAVAIERNGRSLTFASARVTQGDRTVVLVRSTSARLGDTAGGGLAFDHHRPRPRPAGPPEGAGRFGTGGLVRHFEEFDVVMDPDVAPFSGGGDAWLAAWLRPLRGDAIDDAWLVAACDVLPPATFARTTGPTRAATLDYTVHLTVAAPAGRVGPGEWVYLDCRAPVAADGMAVEDGALWGPDGTVLAVSRQTRLADAKVPPAFAGLADGGADPGPVA
jgi:acyl-CoA thioesterase